MRTSIYRPRVVIEVTEEQFDKIRRYIPFGIRKSLFSVIIDSLIDAFEKTGGSTDIIAAILSRSFGAEDFLRKRKPDNGNSG